MQNIQKNALQKVYSLVGFVVVWTLTLALVWSIFHQDQTIAYLVKIAEALQ